MHNKKIVNVPEFNDNFNVDSLSLNYIFNWGIENKINIGLFYDSNSKKFNVIGDFKLENRKWWQLPRKKFMYSNNDLDTIMKQCNGLLNLYNYNVDYNNSKNFRSFISYINKITI